ncbi:cytochrome P450 89A2-like isoform X3 [Cucurbita moschata]|uniref:Cytochrome P450 89A2-like isoform X3 n=1 Tax=Cucurbita moschata TaxID=3662 RepID=A0A6J1FV82_CUCMO|nr:cytochrome P450 89A2-like isoform X3 [Cucurbita moschata]
MEIWFIILVSLCISYVLSSILSHFRSSTKLPPGPPSIPIISTFLWLRTSPLQLESYLRTAVAKYGPIVTLRIGSRISIFIADRTIAHNALLQHGALFADRPPPPPLTKILFSNQHSIHSAPYGPLWRLLRRNLTSQILHPSRVRSYAPARKWVLDILLKRLLSHSESGTPVCVADHFQYAMFCLLVLMCFGDKLDEPKIKEVENVQRTMLLNLTRFNVLNFWPKFTKILLRKRWQTLLQLRKNQEDVIIPLIEARRKANQNRGNRGNRENRVNRANRADTEEEKEEFVVSYVDTLLDLEIPDEDNRKLTNEEIVTICSEFLNAGTDTTSTALQWIMANLVKYPEIQHKLFAEIKGVMGDRTGEEVKEEDLRKVPYLKAVVLEGLRRHPPGHFVLPHAVKEETELENYVIPKYGTVDFMVAEMGWDPKVWEDPAAFMPERFLKGGKEEEEEVAEFDITGSKEIKMMPFGAGRRICPGFGLAILHLEYFLANLVWRSEWKAVEGDEVDLSEKLELTVVMKKPLKARIYSRG